VAGLWQQGTQFLVLLAACRLPLLDGFSTCAASPYLLLIDLHTHETGEIEQIFLWVVVIASGT
jgi:hypothetical protein